MSDYTTGGIAFAYSNDDIQSVVENISRTIFCKDGGVADRMGVLKAKRAYICDQTRCGDRCSAKEGLCTHTMDIAFAKFRSPSYKRKWCYSEENEPILWEITHEEYYEVINRAGVENRPTE